MVDIAFRRRIQTIKGGKNFLVSVPPVLVEALGSEEVVFLVRDGNISLIPAHKG